MSFERMRWIYHEVHRHCSDEFYYKYSDQIYKTIQREYLWLDLNVDEKIIAKIVQEYKDFWGEE